MYTRQQGRNFGRFWPRVRKNLARRHLVRSGSFSRWRITQFQSSNSPSTC